MAIEPDAAAAVEPVSTAATPVPARRGWLRRLVAREYLHRRPWKMGASATDSGGGSGSGGASRLARLSRSLRSKRLSGLSVSLRSSSASALLDALAFRVMYVVEAVVLGLALSCFFLCCGCHL